MKQPKYPHVHVAMVGEDGNAFAIMARVSAALKRAGHEDAATAFRREAVKGDYDHLLRTVMQTVSIDSEEDL